MSAYARGADASDHDRDRHRRNLLDGVLDRVLGAGALAIRRRAACPAEVRDGMTSLRRRLAPLLPMMEALDAARCSHSWSSARSPG